MLSPQVTRALAKSLTDVLVEHGADEEEVVAGALQVTMRLHAVEPALFGRFDVEQFEADVRAAYRGE